MAEKAKTLRKINDIFKPEPLTPDKMSFYQETAKVRDNNLYEYHDMLFEQIVDADEPMHFLAIGHGGCGKSTEIHILAEKLKNEAKTPSIIINATKELNMTDFSYVDVFILIVEHLIKYANDSGITVNKRIISAFNKALSTKTMVEYRTEDYNTAIEAGVEAAFSPISFLEFMSKISTSARMDSGLRKEMRSELSPKISDIVESVNALIYEIKKVRKNIVIMMDGLEKCVHEHVRALFINNGQILASIKTHMVIACPISIYRSSDGSMLQSYFSQATLMPMIKTHEPGLASTENDKGAMVVKELVLKRVEPSLFEDGILEKIVNMGGGHLRDTFKLLKDIAFHAYMSKKEIIDEDSFNANVNAFAADIFLRAKSELYPTLKQIYDGNHNVRNDNSLNELLYAGAVFEYNGKRWVDLHPAIRYYVDENQGVLESDIKNKEVPSSGQI